METEFIDLAGSLKSYLYRLTASRQDAEDLLHDTYLRVRDKWHTFQGKSSFKTWVFAIATNLARDNQRVKKRWVLEVQDKCKGEAIANPAAADRIVHAFQSQTEKTFEITEHINYCFTCIAKNLDLEKQIAIVLKEMYDFSRDEIGKILNVSEGVVKHLLFEGRKELQSKYQQRCALINKEGVCYQCAELNDFLQGKRDAEEKIKAMPFSRDKDADANLTVRFQLIHDINPLEGKGARVEDVILQILNETLDREAGN
ncbi:MAG: RNA polymerase sigma factor [Cyclobacteriaceae bacterium]|nr:RNA polymerase sigma factor [Cyclobacteriaceae bacterium]